MGDIQPSSSQHNKNDEEEWKLFIQQELEKMEKQENELEQKDTENKAEDDTEFTLGSLVEQIPIEDFLDSAIGFVKKKTQPKKRKMRENEERPKKRIPLAGKLNPEEMLQIAPKNQSGKSAKAKAKRRRERIYRYWYGN